METGHSKNVANFETVTIILTSLGARYAPPQALILLPTLKALLEEAKAALTDIDTAQAAKTVKVDEAQAEFEGLQKYVVNIKRQAEIEVNDPAFTEDLQTIVNEFHPPGRKTGLVDNPDTPEDESRTAVSQSQQSRDNQLANLADISALLKTREEYKATGTPYATTAIGQNRNPDRPKQRRRRNRRRPRHKTRRPRRTPLHRPDRLDRPDNPGQKIRPPNLRQRQRSLPTTKRA